MAAAPAALVESDATPSGNTPVALGRFAWTCGLSTRSCALGAADLRERPSARARRPVKPAAGSVCPMFALMLVTDSGGTSEERGRSTTPASEPISIGSPSPVPVPCACA